MFSYKKNEYTEYNIIPCIFEENEERPLEVVVGFIGTAIVFHWFLMNLSRREKNYSEVLEEIDEKKKILQ